MFDSSSPLSKPPEVTEIFISLEFIMEITSLTFVTIWLKKNQKKEETKSTQAFKDAVFSQQRLAPNAAAQPLMLSWTTSISREL